MKFRLLLWFLGYMMAKASRKDLEFQKKLGDKNLNFRIYTMDGKISRVFSVANQRLTHKSGTADNIEFGIGFKDAAYAAATMGGRGNPQAAFLKGIKDKDIEITGNAGMVLWFQDLAKRALKKKKKNKPGDSAKKD